MIVVNWVDSRPEKYVKTTKTKKKTVTEYRMSIEIFFFFLKLRKKNLFCGFLLKDTKEAQKYMVLEVGKGEERQEKDKRIV